MTFVSSIYHNPCSIFKSKPYKFHNKNIGLFSVNDTIMAGYFMGIYRDLCMKNYYKLQFHLYNLTV